MKTQDDILALQRWEDEGGRVQPARDERARARTSRRVDESRAPVRALTSLAKEPW